MLTRALRHSPMKVPMRGKLGELFTIAKKENQKIREHFREGSSGEYSILHRLLYPVHLNMKAWLVLVGIGTSIMLPWVFFFRPALDAYKEQTHELVRETPTSKDEQDSLSQSMPSEYKPAHVFKLKDIPSL